jgi:hypothetical protein
MVALLRYSVTRNRCPNGYHCSLLATRVVRMNTDKGLGLNGAMAAEIRAERAAKEMTIDQLAAAIGVSKTRMLAILKPSGSIHVDDLAALSEVFNLEPVELMQRANARLKNGRS